MTKHIDMAIFDAEMLMTFVAVRMSQWFSLLSPRWLRLSSGKDGVAHGTSNNKLQEDRKSSQIILNHD